MSSQPAKFAELPFECKCVVVLMQAPVDQSPRMLAQAKMLAELGASVRIVAFGQPEDLPVSHPRIHFYGIPGSGRDTRAHTNWPVLRVVTRSATMLGQLRRELRIACQGADLLLAQLPPVLPGLFLALRQQLPVVLDWHNLSAPLAALKFGAAHPVVTVLDKMEAAFGRRARAHFAVTEALAQHLAQRLPAQVCVLPDRPSYSGKSGGFPSPLVKLEGTRDWFNLVSPTSWSRDEPMDVLLDAVSMLDIPNNKGLRLVVSGKGPLREAFEERALRMSRPNLRIETGWFTLPEYHGLLENAHCEISMHRSASGLDFPMKIIDMEAAGLPVIALDYGPALHEGLFGLQGATSFTDAEQLAGILQQRIEADGWPRSACRPETWQDCWKQTALPLFAELLS